MDKIVNENIEKARVKLYAMTKEYGFETGKTIGSGILKNLR